MSSEVKPIRLGLCCMNTTLKKQKPPQNRKYNGVAINPSKPVEAGPQCPYKVGDACVYNDRICKKQTPVTISMVSWEGIDWNHGEEPMIAVLMPDGNVRDTVLSRLSLPGK